MDSGRRQRGIRAAIGLLMALAITAALVMLAPPSIYLWLKALHIVSAGTWIGGMLGIVYLLSWHAGVTDPGTAKVLSRVENGLLVGAVNPAMVVAWGIGLWLAWDAGWFVGGWLRAKLALAFALSALHGWVVGAVRTAGAGTLEQRAATFRNVSVVATLITVGVIVLAVVKPM